MSRKTTEITSSSAENLPEEKSVYSIWAKSKTTDEPINCKYVGETEDLRKRTQDHFNKSEPNQCLKEFMQSTLTKIMIYELMPGSLENKRTTKELDWIEEFNPKCNE